MTISTTTDDNDVTSKIPNQSTTKKRNNTKSNSATISTSPTLSTIPLVLNSNVVHQYLYWGSFCVLGFVLLFTQFVPLPVAIQMLSYTFPIIYIGSHTSLQQKEIDPITGEKPMKTDSMTQKDAMLFPVIGSAALLSLYMAYKFLPSYWVNLLLTAYLSLFGCVALAETFHMILEKLLAPNFNKIIINMAIPLPSYLEEKLGPLAIEASTSHTMSYLLAGCVGCGWMYTNNWVLHNMFAIGFCLQAIRMVSVGNFTIATILLSGLFVYDIFWVFGTDVMVTVAKSFEAPAKLIFPVSLHPWRQSILGLGDIVLPGIFIAMVLRFDHSVHEGVLAKKTDNLPSDASGKVNIHQHFSKFFFWTNILFYEVGLMTTCVVMNVFNHPQPALLYLVPFCLSALFGPAWFTGSLPEVMAYSEEDPPKKEEGEGGESGEGKGEKEKGKDGEASNAADNSNKSS